MVDQPGDVSIPTDVENQLEDDVVQSLAEVAGTFWRPATDGGAAVDPDDGDFWEFVSDGDGIGIIGHDGCNRFATSRGLEDPPPRLENGVLVDLEVASTLMDCPGDANGPYPQQGDLLRLVDRGDRLLVETDGAVRVELTQVDSRSADGATTDPASFTTLDAFADIVRAYWVPIEQHGEPVESSLGAFWRLGGGSGDISLSGFDGCDHFRSDQFPEAATTMTDGVFLDDVITTSTNGCKETSAGVQPTARCISRSSSRPPPRQPASTRRRQAAPLPGSWLAPMRAAASGKPRPASRPRSTPRCLSRYLIKSRVR